MARPKESTTCPRCTAPIPIKGERSRCPACGQAVRFADVPDRPCVSCGRPVALMPGKEALRCPACGTWQAAEADRDVVAKAACPRCGRLIDVGLTAPDATCRFCGSRLLLADTL